MVLVDLKNQLPSWGVEYLTGGGSFDVKDPEVRALIPMPELAIWEPYDWTTTAEQKRIDREAKRKAAEQKKAAKRKAAEQLSSHNTSTKPGKQLF